MKILSLFGILGLLLTSCTSAEDPKSDAANKKTSASTKPIHVDPLLATGIIQTEKPVLLDVRTPGEFTTGTIKGSRNLDFNSPDFEEQIAKLDKSKTYLVYCRSGNRSGQALPMLEKLKLSKLYHLDGGIKAWKGAGNPVD
jgi:rhodanese-related sulfurtransferase